MERTSLLQHDIPVATREQIGVSLLEWYRAHKRDLPWRGASPYAVWVSEIMLQQTQVITVIPYFLRFLARFPTVEVLAAAPIDEVLKYWAGLGYYARARNLHRAAQLVVEQHGGHVPQTPEEIETLPGIGRYTAGAILSIAYGVPRPLVDGNVIRVLSRLFGLRGDPKSKANQNTLWRWAEQLVPSQAPGDFNQALMELGALVCSPADPRCERCPLLSLCVAGNSPDPTALPEIPPSRAAVSVTHSSALIRNDAGRLLIAQRPLHGLWGGLWEFPRVVCGGGGDTATGETPQQGAARAAREVVGLEVHVGARVGKVKHGVTHYRITLHGFDARPIDPTAVPYARDCAAIRWETPDALSEYPFSAPQALLRAALLKREGSRHDSMGQLQPSLLFEETADYDDAPRP
jgi:A/G-specific adenine glycosylase